ncbi:MAG: hypothetical protein KGI91_12350 [Burkholderiales bacterium]|nr:hypothetical protein [Burkholderiales bacterium]MDE2077844.1 hypothetical protein [Burkholderiales bacterium]MDE2432289.1 hypothetical protein [Burkholderiales bacterium]
MSSSRPFPAQVPTLTEVVEATPIPEPQYADETGVELGGGIVTDHPPQPIPLEVADPPSGLAHDIAVLTEVVPESEVLPLVGELLEETSSEAGQMVAAAESGALTPELEQDLTDQITERLVSSLTPVLDQLAQQLVQDLQADLGKRLRPLVAQAVAQELNKRCSN